MNLLGAKVFAAKKAAMFAAAAVIIPTVWLPNVTALSYLGFLGVLATGAVVGTVSPPPAPSPCRYPYIVAPLWHVSYSTRPQFQQNRVVYYALDSGCAGNDVQNVGRSFTRSSAGRSSPAPRRPSSTPRPSRSPSASWPLSTPGTASFRRSRHP